MNSSFLHNSHKKHEKKFGLNGTIPFFFKTRYELKQKTNLTNRACDEILKLDIYSMKFKEYWRF